MRAFSRCSSLRSICLPDSIVEIAPAAFSECISLEEVKLPSYISELADSLFRSCVKLDNVVVPKEVRNIWSGVFCGCRCLKNITMSDMVLEIGNYAFQGCSSLEYIRLSANIAEIKSDTFKKCVQLREIDIPLFVTTLSDSAFEGCTSLSRVALPAHLRVIRTCCFAECVSLRHIDIPESVTELGLKAFDRCNCEIVQHDIIPKLSEKAFEGFNGKLIAELTKKLDTDNMSAQQAQEYLCYELLRDGTYEITAFNGEDTKVVIPRYIDGVKVTTIGDGAFSPLLLDNNDACDDIIEVILPDSISTICHSAFMGCSHLKHINIPQSVNIVERRAFSDCVSLEEISFSDNICRLEDNMLKNCRRLKHIHLPQQLAIIGRCIFDGCDSLRSVFLPEKLYSVTADTFNYSSIAEIQLHHDNPYLSLRDGVLYSSDGKTLIRCPECLSAEEIIIPDGVEIVNINAFADCKNIGAVTLPESVLAVRGQAFLGCRGMKRIVIKGYFNCEYSAFDRVSEYCIICLKEVVGECKRYEHNYALILRLVAGYLIGKNEGYKFDDDVADSYEKLIIESYMQLYDRSINDKRLLRLFLRGNYINGDDIPLLLSQTSDTELAAELLEYGKRMFGYDGIGSNYKLD